MIPKPTPLAECPGISCSCPPAVEFGTYEKMVTLRRPAHMYPTDRGDMIQVDRCMEPLIQWLWGNWIWTLECCCGHGRVDPYVAVHPSSHNAMHGLGFRKTRENGSCFELCADHECNQPKAEHSYIERVLSK